MSDTPRTDEWKLKNKCATWPEVGINPFDFARQLERELNAANERINLLERACAKQNEEICQTAGKALGYPWFKDDQKNFTGATEADGVCVGEHVAETIVSELAKKHAEAHERIKQLEEAGDAMDPHGDSDCDCIPGDIVLCKHCHSASLNWQKAKQPIS